MLLFSQPENEPENNDYLVALLQGLMKFNKAFGDENLAGFLVSIQ
jgi:hypothetical protein